MNNRSTLACVRIGIAGTLALVLLTGMVTTVLTGCDDKEPPPGKKADKPDESPAVADTPSTDTPAQAAASAAALADLKRFQRAVVYIEASVPYNVVATGEETETVENELAAHFGSQPAHIEICKMRLPVTWNGTKFRISGTYTMSPDMADESTKGVETHETVDITGEIDPSCGKILWLKALRDERYFVGSTEKVIWSQEKLKNLAVEVGEIPRVSHSDEHGWAYELDSDNLQSIKSIKHSDVYIDISTTPDGDIKTYRRESRTTGELPKYGKMSVTFYMLPK